MDAICAEADDGKIPFSVLFMHAGDQLLTSEAFIVFATEIIEIYKNKYRLTTEEIYSCLGINNHSNPFSCMTRFRAEITFFI